MKRMVLILSAIVTLFSILFVAQNQFLFGLPFIHEGSDVTKVGACMGISEYSGDIGFNTNNIYFVRFYPIILATVNVNQNTQGTYVSDGTTSEVLRKVNWVKWKWVVCLDRKYAVQQSLPHPNGEPAWKYPFVFPLLIELPVILLILLILSKISFIRSKIVLP